MAQRTSLSVRKVQELAQRGRIPAARLEGVWTFDPEQIDAWIRARETGTEGPPPKLDVPGPFGVRATRPSYLKPGEIVEEAYNKMVRGGRAKPLGVRGESTAEAYERLIRKKRPKDTKAGATSQRTKCESNAEAFDRMMQVRQAKPKKR